MPGSAPRRLHRAASLTATVVVAALLSSSLLAQPFLTGPALHALRQAMLTAVPVLVLAMATAAGTGRRLAGGSTTEPIRSKRRRTAAIAAIGVFALVPTAILLERLTARGGTGTTFTVLVTVEPVLGAVNLALLLANVRTGLRLTGRRRRATVSR